MNVNWSPFPLSDGRWADLARMVPLPDAARDDLQRILGLGKALVEHESAAPAPGETKKSLKAVRRKAEALLAELRRVMSAASPDVLMALISPPENPEKAGRFEAPIRLTGYHLLGAHMENVGLLADWLRVAEGRTPKGKSGDRTWTAHFVTGKVDTLLRNHNAGAKSGGLTPEFGAGVEFLDACFDLIGIKVTAAAMIKRMASERKRQSPRQKQSGTSP